LHPVLRHKGKIAQRVTVDGKAGHSSRPISATTRSIMPRS